MPAKFFCLDNFFALIADSREGEEEKSRVFVSYFLIIVSRWGFASTRNPCLKTNTSAKRVKEV